MFKIINRLNIKTFFLNYFNKPNLTLLSEPNLKERNRLKYFMKQRFLSFIFLLPKVEHLHDFKFGIS